MGRSTVHYADNETNNILKRLHNKLRPAGTPVQRVEYIIELLLLRIFEVKLKHDKTFEPLRKLFGGENYRLLFSHLLSLTGDQIKQELNKNFFPFNASILSKAREFFKGNLPQKVQDQLVLIEEVFANSSFSTNVQSGNMAEIVGLVQEIDEDRVLKTDLLGDAIESALSETGGTQDIGLHRTPDHIREMMVAMVNPDFKDTIFDPACGTGGFLFDAYNYVLEKATQDNKWPGIKAHSELEEYFKKYFKQFSDKMPSANIANAFYRSGINGIEYLGMIRKMAAINLYIRGLNPQNIEQGDSLKLFNPSVDAGSKSVVIANPPFGAERDQPAYPNVWEEFSRESETTILFVKLMFDALQKGGRCAVIVSEGFLTWSQNSARAIRKLLLDEANLKGIISLPQGVFVSKNGQGAKTSVLYFEKGEPTKNVWYYKITNDGYSMGVNRKEIPGSQLPEVIEIFNKYVKHGKNPPETKNSFLVPAEWIKTVDPRLKERIKQETKQEMVEKNKEKREKLVSQLDEKLKADKITKKDYQEKLWQFDNVLENKIQNEIAKRIEKAHSYSFNLQNYRSSLTQEQRSAWYFHTSSFVPFGGKGTKGSLDHKYESLQKAKPLNAVQILGTFDPENALEMDITREYLSQVEKKNEKLKKLEEVLKEGIKYHLVPLRDYIIENSEKIKPKNFPDIEFIVLGVSNEKGIFVNERLKGSEIKQSYYKVLPNQFCYNPYRVNVGSIGLNKFDYKNQIISGAYSVFSVNENELIPEYLLALLETKKFLNYVSELANGGVRMDFKIDYLKNWKIPLPPIEVQEKIVEKIKRQKNIIDGAEKILGEQRIDSENFIGENVTLENVINTQYGYTDSAKEVGEFRLVRITDIDEWGKLIKKDIVYTNLVNKKDKKNYLLNEGDLLLVRTGATYGKILFFNDKQKSVFASYLIRLLPRDKNKIDTKYLWYYSFSDLYWKQVNDLVSGGTQPQFNANKIIEVKIPLPSIEIQKQIVAQLDKEIETLQKIRELKGQAEKRIEKILDEVWGEK